MFNKTKKIISLFILLSFTFSISYADDKLDVKTYVNDMRSSSYASGILGDIFTKIFDTEGQIKDIFLSCANTITDGFMPLISAGQIIDSPIYSLLGNVGIGTTILTEKLTILGGISISKSPDSGDDVGNRDYNDARYLGLFGTSSNSNLLDSLDSTAFQKDIALFSCSYGIASIGDDGSIVCTTDNGYDSTPDTIADDGIIQETEIAQNTIDDSEIEDNSISSGSLAPNSVGDSELIDNPTFINPTASTPTATGHLATKDYVDTAVTASSGGKDRVLKWSGSTTSSVTNSWGTGIYQIVAKDGSNIYYTNSLNLFSTSINMFSTTGSSKYSILGWFMPGTGFTIERIYRFE